MTLAVVDASVALKLFLAEQGSAEAEALSHTHDLIAPDLILTEMLNALWKANRRGLVGGKQGEQIVKSISRPFSALMPSDELCEHAWKICVTLDHPAYDAFYIALAQREGCAMVTADDRLYRKTCNTRFAKVVRPLL